MHIQLKMVISYWYPFQFSHITAMKSLKEVKFITLGRNLKIRKAIKSMSEFGLILATHIHFPSRKRYVRIYLCRLTSCILVKKFKRKHFLKKFKNWFLLSDSKNLKALHSWNYISHSLLYQNIKALRWTQERKFFTMSVGKHWSAEIAYSSWNEGQEKSKNKKQDTYRNIHQNNERNIIWKS